MTAVSWQKKEDEAQESFPMLIALDRLKVVLEMNKK